MGVRRLSYKERQYSSAGTTKTAHTKRHTVYCHINFWARSTPAHCLQPALYWVQGRSPYILEERTGY